MSHQQFLKSKTIAIVGGCGHVGLPLGVKFALAGAETWLIDINGQAVNRVNSGNFPFVESGGDEQLRQALDLGLKATRDPAVRSKADVIVFVIGTRSTSILIQKFRSPQNLRPLPRLL